MVFKISHSVDANTTAQDPDWQKLQIMQGELKQIMILLPVEASNLLQLQIRYHGHQILPFNEDEWLYGGGYPFKFEYWLILDESPFEFDIYGKNSDTAKAHEYNIYCNIKPPSPLTPTEMDEQTAADLEELLGG